MPNQSNNQRHGKVFENLIKAANGIFTLAAADRQRAPNERFDIAADDDIKFGLPTSIKSTGGNTIALSDARLFWQSFDFSPYRLLVGTYRQEGRIKVFETIHEMILRDKYRTDLLGGISESKINEFHDTLQSFPAGPEGQSRASMWAQERKQALKPDVGLVTLNPKIDSKNQRRLQCSIRLTELIETLDDDDHTLHTEDFGSLILPIRISSGKRRLKGSL